MTVLFRCNAGPVIGYDHLTRCRALAQALRRQGETCVMVGPDAADARPEDREIFAETGNIDMSTHEDLRAFVSSSMSSPSIMRLGS